MGPTVGFDVPRAISATHINPLPLADKQLELTLEESAIELGKVL